MTLRQFTCNLSRFTTEFLTRFILYIIAFIIISTHQLYLYLPCFDIGVECISNDLFNDYVSTILSTIGFALVVYSMNENHRLINGTSLLHYFQKKMPDTPFKNKTHITVLDSGSFTMSTSLNPSITVTMNPQTFEDLTRVVNEGFARHEIMLENLKKEMKKDIEGSSKEINDKLEKTNESTQQLEQKISSIALGATDIQIIGSFLVLYAAFINI
jgi:hypothetical protein